MNSKTTLTSAPTSTVTAKLDKHLVACSAAAVGAVSFFGSSAPAQADIIYSGLQNAPIFPAAVNGGVYINVETPFGFAQGTRPAGWDLNPYKSGQSLYVNSNTRVQLASSLVANLALGAPIDASQTFSGTGFYGGVATPIGSTGFIGFSFDPDSVPGAQTWYGWFRLTVAAEPGTGYVVDWAYDNTGAGLNAGDGITAVPEPSTISLAALAMGAVGVRALRQRKSQVAK